MRGREGRGFIEVVDVADAVDVVDVDADVRPHDRIEWASEWLKRHAGSLSGCHRHTATPPERLPLLDSSTPSVSLTHFDLPSAPSRHTTQWPAS